MWTVCACCPQSILSLSSVPCVVMEKTKIIRSFQIENFSKASTFWVRHINRSSRKITNKLFFITSTKFSLAEEKNGTEEFSEFWKSLFSLHKQVDIVVVIFQILVNNKIVFLCQPSMIWLKFFSRFLEFTSQTALDWDLGYVFCKEKQIIKDNLIIQLEKYFGLYLNSNRLLCI